MNRFSFFVFVIFFTFFQFATSFIYAQDQKKNVVTTLYPLYISTLNIVRNVPDIDLINIGRPSVGCLHDYQLTAEDLMILGKADILIVNGGGMESFLDKTLKRFPKLKIINASTGIRPLFYHGQENSHFWVSPTNAIKQVENIGNALALEFPKDSSLIKKNTGNYTREIQDLRKKMHEHLKSIRFRNIVTFHEAFPYFAQEFDLNIVSVIENEPGQGPSAGQLRDLIFLIKREHVKALFVEPQYPLRVAYTLGRETHVPVYSLDPAVTGDSGPNAQDAYIKIMEKNLQVLEQALK